MSSMCVGGSKGKDGVNREDNADNCEGKSKGMSKGKSTGKSMGKSKDGKLTPRGRSLAKLMDRIMPDEKGDEWGWNLSRKERAAIKRRAAEKKAAEEKKKAGSRQKRGGGVRGSPVFWA